LNVLLAIVLWRKYKIVTVTVEYLFIIFWTSFRSKNRSITCFTGKYVCTGNENSKPIWNKFIIRKDIIETSQVVLNFCRVFTTYNSSWESFRTFTTYNSSESLSGHLQHAIALRVFQDICHQKWYSSTESSNCYMSQLFVLPVPELTEPKTH
jgi:hypothetical protein